jgi:transposase
MCRGNNESEGKGGKTPTGSRSLRAALVQAAWAASHQKGTYLAAQYKRLGKKKALIAVGPSILIMVYHVLQNRMLYQDLGGDYFERRNVDKQCKQLLRQLASLGVKVTIEEI